MEMDRLAGDVKCAETAEGRTRYGTVHCNLTINGLNDGHDSAEAVLCADDLPEGGWGGGRQEASILYCR
jgi:hypothetical protein